MSIKGALIKGAIHFKEALTPSVNHLESQKAVLKHLLDTAKDTEFGKAYNF